MGPADRAQIFFYCGGAFFDADRDLGLLRGGRIGADCRHGEYHRYVLNNTDGNRWLIPPAAVATGREPYMSHFQGITNPEEKPPAPIRMDTGGAR